MEHNVTVFTRAPKAGAGATRGVIHQFASDAASQETLQVLRTKFPKQGRPTLADLQALLPKPADPAASLKAVQRAVISQISILASATHLRSSARASSTRSRTRRSWPMSAIRGPKLGLAALTGEQVPAGRAAKLSRRRVGKVGWKANIGNLSEFVRVACANELGLGNPLQAQPASLSQPGYRPRGLDLTDQQCDQMTAYDRVRCRGLKK